MHGETIRKFTGHKIVAKEEVILTPFFFFPNCGQQLMRAEEAAATMGEKERKAKEGGRKEEGKGKGKGKNEYFSFRKQAPSVVIHRRALSTTFWCLSNWTWRTAGGVWSRSSEELVRPLPRATDRAEPVLNPESGGLRRIVPSRGIWKQYQRESPLKLL